MFSVIPINYNEKDQELVIGKRVGSFPGMLETRTFEIIKISKEKPSGLDFTSKPVQIVKYDGKQQTTKINQ